MNDTCKHRKFQDEDVRRGVSLRTFESRNQKNTQNKECDGQSVGVENIIMLPRSLKVRMFLKKMCV
jgi:hypothetical protein